MNPDIDPNEPITSSEQDKAMLDLAREMIISDPLTEYDTLEQQAQRTVRLWERYLLEKGISYDQVTSDDLPFLKALKDLACASPEQMKNIFKECLNRLHSDKPD